MPDHLREQIEAALLGRYRMEREIASGGMATVFLVHDEKHRRPVALKIVRPGAAEGGAQRFLREVEVTARLSHPHILPLLDSGTVDGLPFYVMPFVEGETLRERMARDGRMPLTDAVHLAAEVSDALAYAHAQGIVHRDIKPANILLSGRHAIVADFGVAKALVAAAGSDVTEAGMAVGTVAYMSPEQAVGEGPIDGRSDIYSLAIVLFEMLAGEKAFGGATAHEQLARRFSGVIPSVRARRGEIPEAVDAVLARALAADPAGRYPTAAEFEAALLAAVREGDASFSTGVIHVARAPASLPSIAVLPFENLTGAPDAEYLSDGLAEELLMQLARRRTMRVCARSSSFALRGAGLDARAIGQRLGVGHLLTGSVRRAGERLRVSAQLVNTADGFQSWSERYDRQVTDVFAIQDEIAAAIATALHATLLGAVTAPRAVDPPRLEVYEALLRGRHFASRRTADAMTRAIEYFREALALDPDHAPAWAALAELQVTRGVYGTAPPAEVLPLAREAAETALARDPSLAVARAALAQCEVADAWRWVAAEEMFRQAIALDPQLPVAYQGLAMLALTPRGRHDEARRTIERALTIDPLSALLRVTQAGVLLYAREYDAAVRAAQAVLALEPTFAPAHFFLAQALLELGAIDDARTHAQAAVEAAQGSSETLAVLACVAARAGQPEDARAILARIEAVAATRYVSPAHPALVHAALGDHDRAMTCLEAARAARAPDLIWLAVRPAWDALRQHPGHDRLLRRLQLNDR